MNKHYDYPVYWQLPDDGAKFKCTSCNEYKNHTEVILTQIPIDDSRRVICLECIDESWFKSAKDLGIFPD